MVSFDVKFLFINLISYLLLPKCHNYVPFPYGDSAALFYEGAKHRRQKVGAQKFGVQHVGR